MAEDEKNVAALWLRYKETKSVELRNILAEHCLRASGGKFAAAFGQGRPFEQRLFRVDGRD